MGGFSPAGKGYITLSGVEDGKGTLRYYFRDKSQCFTGGLDVTVQETELETVIEIPSKFTGCSHARYYIKKDGSGGRAETLAQDGKWVSGRDLDLTARN